MADDLERFINLSFSQHIIILTEEKNIEKRWKYIKLAIENKWDKRFLKAQIKDCGKCVTGYRIQGTYFIILQQIRYPRESYKFFF